MGTIRSQLEMIINALDRKIDGHNKARRITGAMALSPCEIRLLGQTSLLVNPSLTALLSLAQTADVDALLRMDAAVKNDFVALLLERGFLYDEDSPLIWIPPGARFDPLFQLRNVSVSVIDPESALVSKAVKAPHKNRQLLRQAISSGKFPNLVTRIEKAGGNLEVLAQD